MDQNLEETGASEKCGVHMEEHLLIRDVTSGEVILDQRADIVTRKYNLGNTDAG
jgi:glutamine phosphoribosylpyrophosphate amidotransferase